MALNNLFDMVKADRYTQDGREELIKAQEAETEDKVYQIGEISQKTGLQKTANGWVKPKNGKQPGAKKEEYKPSRRVDPKKHPQVSNPDVLGMTSNGAKKRFEALGGKFVENKDGVDIFKTRDGDLVKVHYGDNKKVARTETTHISEPDTAPETLAKVSHDNLDVARNEMNTTPEEDQMLDYFVTEMHEDGTGLDEIIKRQDGIYERSNGAYPKEEKTYKSLREKIMNHYAKAQDAAPRVLTGDTRIRVRKA